MRGGRISGIKGKKKKENFSLFAFKLEIKKELYAKEYCSETKGIGSSLEGLNYTPQEGG